MVDTHSETTRHVAVDRTLTAPAALSSNIHVAQYDAESFPPHLAAGPPDEPPGSYAVRAWWRAFERYRAEHAVRPSDTRHVHNVTTTFLHTLIISLLDYTTPREMLTPVLAVGTATTPQTSTGSTTLTDPAATVSVSQFNVSGRIMRFRTFLASNDANGPDGTGIDITEAGISTGTLWNHGVFGTPIEKDDQSVVTVTVELSVRDVSEVSA